MTTTSSFKSTFAAPGAWVACSLLFCVLLMVISAGTSTFQGSQALAGGRKDRVGDRGDDRRGPGLAHPSRRLAAVHDVNLDGRRLVHPEHPVIVEIALLDATVLERDLSVQRCRDAEDDRALDL